VHTAVDGSWLNEKLAAAAAWQQLQQWCQAQLLVHLSLPIRPQQQQQQLQQQQQQLGQQPQQQ
jgi:hypothetical protein